MPTYDFECERCSIQFELRDCPVGQKTAICVKCAGEATWVAFGAASWSQTHSGIFRPAFCPALGHVVESRKQFREGARAIGAVPSDGFEVGSRGRPMPTLDQAERARRDLKRSEVLHHREQRERLEYEDRNGPGTAA
jgi:hypothetical protein